MNTTLTRLAMAAPIVAALLALSSGWDVAQAQPGPNVDDITTNQPVVDPPKPPVKHWPVVDIDGIDEVDPGDAPEPPADDPAPPSDTDDDSDHDDDSDNDSDDNATTHGGSSTGGTRPVVSKPTPSVEETDTVFQASDARNASESISPKFLEDAGVQQPPVGLVFGLGAVLVAVIGWAAYRHHRLSA
jgi:hypothetical protein